MRKTGVCAILLAAIGALLSVNAAGAKAPALSGDGIIVGTESAFPPFEFYNEKGELVGFDLDIAHLIGEKLGKEIVVSEMAFDGLIPALLSDKIDIIAAGLSVTEERAKKINFSITYYSTPDAIVTKSGAKGFSEPEDLAGKVLSVQLGSIQDLYVSGLQGVKAVKRFKTVAECLYEVLYGRADATCLDGTVAVDQLAKTKDFAGALEIAMNITHPGVEGMALGLSKKDPELLEAVNAVLKDFIGTPAYEEMKAKWGIK